MHPVLEEINRVYSEIEKYLEPAREYIFSLRAEQIAEFDRKRRDANGIFKDVFEKLGAILPALSSQEIIEGYQQGCQMFRGSLGGWMSHHFDNSYIPIMIQAVKDDDRVVYIFLGTLREQLDRKSFSEILMSALDCKFFRSRDRALSWIYDIKLVEAIPRIRAMTQDPEPMVAETAKQVLQWFEEQK